MTAKTAALPGRDLLEVERIVGSRWERFRDANVLLTGGSGFVGRWLIESFLSANSRFGLGASLWALTRDAARFRSSAPHLIDRALTIVEKDLEAPETTPAGLPARIDFLIHGATRPSAELATGDAAKIMANLESTRRVLDLSIRAGARRFLFLSSGAIYGKQPPGLPRVSEDFPGGPDPLDPASAYAETKRLGELLCVSSNRRSGLEAVVARGFAFVGPLLPLGPKFAAGSFLEALIEGRSISVEGDGAAVRSYLYASDLAAWLWIILAEGSPGSAYNVGSENAVSIADLARETAALRDPPLPVTIGNVHGRTGAAERYVPSTLRARNELGLSETIDLRESLRRTYEWHRQESPKALKACR